MSDFMIPELHICSFCSLCMNKYYFHRNGYLKNKTVRHGYNPNCLQVQGQPQQISKIRPQNLKRKVNEFWGCSSAV